MTKQAHTPKEVADFILDEVLNPFPESSLYDDYQLDWEVTHDDNDQFNDRYDEALRLISAAPELLEALEGMLAWAKRVHISNPGPEIVRACNAIGKARGGT